MRLPTPCQGLQMHTILLKSKNHPDLGSYWFHKSWNWSTQRLHLGPGEAGVPAKSTPLWWRAQQRRCMMESQICKTLNYWLSVWHHAHGWSSPCLSLSVKRETDGIYALLNCSGNGTHLDKIFRTVPAYEKHLTNEWATITTTTKPYATFSYILAKHLKFKKLTFNENILNPLEPPLYWG